MYRSVQNDVKRKYIGNKVKFKQLPLQLEYGNRHFLECISQWSTVKSKKSKRDLTVAV